MSTRIQSWLERSYHGQWLPVCTSPEKPHVPYLITTKDKYVERVSQYKYLGFIIDDQLKGGANTDMLYQKHNQSLHFVRTLNNLHIDNANINLFHRSTIKSNSYFFNYHMVLQANQ